MRSRGMFLGALALLVLNDWFLKGAGVLPAWLTGKLSDVAGMIVAPVVLAAVLALARVPSSAARVIAVSAVALVFAAIKVDAALALRFDSVVSAAVAAFSLPLAAHTVADRSDLIVLPLLGVGGWLAGTLARDRPLRRSGALVAGLLACGATSSTYMPVEPHWGFAVPGAGTMWGARLAGGAVIVQRGRQSADGAFELGIELTAVDAELALDAGDVWLELPGERVMAVVAQAQSSVARVPRGRALSFRYIFHPRATTWPPHSHGVLQLKIAAGDRSEVVRLDLSFDERMVPWPGDLKLR